MLFRLFRSSISMKLGVNSSATHIEVVSAAQRQPEPKELWPNAW
jgi:hypothetical protein